MTLWVMPFALAEKESAVGAFLKYALGFHAGGDRSPDEKMNWLSQIKKKRPR